MSAMDATFSRAADSLFVPGMGTEHVAPLLHSLVRMTRPRRILEVGLGYTSLFLLDALARAAADHRDDLAALGGDRDGSRRAQLLNEHALRPDYSPLMIGIDDFSLAGSSCAQVAAAADALGLAPLLKILPGDFRDVIPRIAKDDLPLDMIWFDCGGRREYVDFLSLAWPLLSPSHGLLALHFTYWPNVVTFPGKAPATFMLPGAILNEIKRQQAELGLEARFEVLSLLEPHKSRQGSITLIRKLPPQDRYREPAQGQSAGGEGLPGFDLRKG